MIPDLTEAEIDAFFGDQGEMEIALTKSTSAPTFGDDLTRYRIAGKIRRSNFRKFRKSSIIFENIYSNFYSYTATQLGE